MIRIDQIILSGLFGLPENKFYTKTTPGLFLLSEAEACPTASFRQGSKLPNSSSCPKAFAPLLAAHCNIVSFEICESKLDIKCNC
jgi:hypothetical protein